MPQTNKFPGRCKCGSEVPAYAGSIAKKSGKWVVTCASCSGAVGAKPQREMLGVLYWPNGEGETPCTEEYQALADRLQDLAGIDTDAAYNERCQLQNDMAVLQADGHLGTSIRYAKPDAFCALLGGGRVTAHGQIVVR